MPFVRRFDRESNAPQVGASVDLSRLLEARTPVAVQDKRAQLAHLQNPEKPERALCGMPLNLRRPVSADSARCVVCSDLSRRSFTDR